MRIRNALHHIGQWLEPEANPAGLIYGVLAVGTVIAAEGTRRETYESVISASVLTLSLYWLAHAYASHFGERVKQRKQWGPRDVINTLVHEGALLKGALPPILVLLLAWAARSRLETGVTVSLWTAGIELLVLELVAGIRQRLSRAELVVEVLTGAALGAGILGIRVLLH